MSQYAQISHANAMQASQLASAYYLGVPQQEYGVRLTAGNIIGGVLCALLGGSAIYSGTASSGVFMLIVGVLLLALGIYILFSPLIYSSWHVYVCSDGFALVRGSKIDAFRWDQIDNVMFRIIRRYRNGIYMGTTYRYTIRGLNGNQVILNNRFANIKMLGESITDMVTRVRLPQAIAAYRAGQMLYFGPLSVSMQGVSNGREIIGWHEISEVSINNGSVAIRKAGKWLNWSSARVSDIPNYYVFFGLVNAIRQGGGRV